jgi:uncharacterized protein (TIGR02646 family)
LNQAVVDTAKANYAAGGAMTNPLYQSQDVQNALRLLYFQKCYLCERDAQYEGLVEHFLPHHRDRPERAFDWKNLHWCCSKCNARKRANKYKTFVPGTKIVATTLLLDPSDPPIPLEQVLTYDSDLRATPTQLFQQDSLAISTAEFLNDAIPQIERDACYRKLADLIIQGGCMSQWKTLIAAPVLDLQHFPAEERAAYLNAMDCADRLYLNFLGDNKPFCSSMRCIVENRLRLPVVRIRDIGRAFRGLNSLPDLY